MKGRLCINPTSVTVYQPHLLLYLWYLLVPTLPSSEQTTNSFTDILKARSPILERDTVPLVARVVANHILVADVPVPGGNVAVRVCGFIELDRVEGYVPVLQALVVADRVVDFRAAGFGRDGVGDHWVGGWSGAKHGGGESEEGGDDGKFLIDYD